MVNRTPFLCIGRCVRTRHSPDTSGSAASLVLLTGFGDDKSPSPRAKGNREQFGWTTADEPAGGADDEVVVSVHH